jgi:hypothetical protein
LLSRRTGWLVGEDRDRVHHERSGDRGPLLLPARELGRPVVEPVAETDAREHLLG